MSTEGQWRSKGVERILGIKRKDVRLLEKEGILKIGSFTETETYYTESSVAKARRILMIKRGEMMKIRLRSGISDKRKSALAKTR
jgi:hypothetical protein